MGQVLDKRTAESRQYDIDCSRLLAAGETIASITSIGADQGALTFGAASVNGVPITYPDGRTVPVGKVVHVLISGGVLLPSQPFLMCTVRALFSTNLSPAVEATELLRLVNTPNI
ncbi:hypothetical protein LJR084_001910 [Variovorax sp. LjRoot84]|uniref:hypothetical protein n=1 Tax=Variovorax sp. LjRoot84 TaxID=3342340 RepID=UPI003ECF122D